MELTFNSFVLAAALVSAAPAVAKERPVAMAGGWELYEQRLIDQEIAPTCIARSPLTAEGVQLRVANRIGPSANVSAAPRGAGQILVKLPPQFTVGTLGPNPRVAAEIPGESQWNEVDGKYVRDSNGYLLVSIYLEEKIDRLIQPLAKGREMKLSLSGSSPNQVELTVPLSGSREALITFEKCLAKVGPAKSPSKK